MGGRQEKVEDISRLSKEDLSFLYDAAIQLKHLVSSQQPTLLRADIPETFGKLTPKAMECRGVQLSFT